MPVFVYEGKTRTGEIKRGDIEAPNQAAVMTKLRAMQLLPTKVKEKGKGLDMEIRIPAFESVGDRELVLFTRQFCTMIDAGLPLVQCLDILANQEKNEKFKRVLFQVKESVESGTTFADALRKHPKVFDDLFVNLVTAGEVGGILDTIMNRLAIFMEKNMKLKKEIKGAMFYPATIMVVAIAVVIILMVFVIPIFAKMFSDFGQALPAMTQMVIDLSNWMQRHILLILGMMVGFVFGVRAIYRTEKGRAKIDDNVLKIPVVGDLIRKIAVARFTRTLGTMVASGVPILEALNITARTAGNKTIEKAVLFTRDAISEGKTIGEPLGQTKVFPSMVTQMITVGETTGALDTMLSKIADFYELEVDQAVATLTSMLEPMMMVFLGAIIGTLVIAMYLPIFTMASAIG